MQKSIYKKGLGLIVDRILKINTQLREHLPDINNAFHYIFLKADIVFRKQASGSVL